MKVDFNLYVCNKKKCKTCMYDGCNYTTLKEFAFVDIPVTEVPDNTVYDGSYILREDKRSGYYRSRAKNRRYNRKNK